MPHRTPKRDRPKTPTNSNANTGDISRSSFLKEVLGGKAAIEFRPIPTAPSPLLGLADSLLRQHALDAWKAAASTVDSIRVLQIVRPLAVMGISVSDEDQLAFVGVSPIFRDTQKLLSDIARHRSNVENNEHNNNAMQLESDVDRWLVGIGNYIRDKLLVLKRIGISSPSFDGTNDIFVAPNPSPEQHRQDEAAWQASTLLRRFDEPTRALDWFWDGFFGRAGGEYDMIDGQLSFDFRFDERQMSDIKRELIEFLNLLESAPATALRSPRSLGPLYPKRLTVDVDEEVAYLDGKPIVVSRDQALFLRELSNNSGDWSSSTTIKASCPELEGSRIDRLKAKLSRELRSVVDSKDGRGYRLKAEFVA